MSSPLSPDPAPTGIKYHARWGSYAADRIATKPLRWEKRFPDQSGENANVAANGIAKLLAMLTE